MDESVPTPTGRAPRHPIRPPAGKIVDVNLIAFLISIVAFIAGIWIMGNAFYVEGFEVAVFIGGLTLTSLGFAVPIHVLKRIDG